MADQILDDDPPSVPKVFTPVRIACTPVDEAMAQLRSDYVKAFISAGMDAPSDLETMTDEVLQRWRWNLNSSPTVPHWKQN